MNMTRQETFWPEEAVKIKIDNLKFANVPVGGKLEVFILPVYFVNRGRRINLTKTLECWP